MFVSSGNGTIATSHCLNVSHSGGLINFHNGNSSGFIDIEFVRELASHGHAWMERLLSADEDNSSVVSFLSGEDLLTEDAGFENDLQAVKAVKEIYAILLALPSDKGKVPTSRKKELLVAIEKLYFKPLRELRGLKRSAPEIFTRIRNDNSSFSDFINSISDDTEIVESFRDLPSFTLDLHRAWKREHVRRKDEWEETKKKILHFRFQAFVASWRYFVMFHDIWTQMEDVLESEVDPLFAFSFGAIILNDINRVVDVDLENSLYLLMVFVISVFSLQLSGWDTHSLGPVNICNKNDTDRFLSIVQGWRSDGASPGRGMPYNGGNVITKFYEEIVDIIIEIIPRVFDKIRESVPASNHTIVDFRTVQIEESFPFAHFIKTRNLVRQLNVKHREAFSRLWALNEDKAKRKMKITLLLLDRKAYSGLLIKPVNSFRFKRLSPLIKDFGQYSNERRVFRHQLMPQISLMFRNFMSDLSDYVDSKFQQEYRSPQPHELNRNCKEWFGLDLDESSSKSKSSRSKPKVLKKKENVTTNVTTNATDFIISEREEKEVIASKSRPLGNNNGSIEATTFELAAKKERKKPSLLQVIQKRIKVSHESTIGQTICNQDLAKVPRTMIPCLEGRKLKRESVKTICEILRLGHYVGVKMVRWEDFTKAFTDIFPTGSIKPKRKGSIFVFSVLKPQSNAQQSSSSSSNSSKDKASPTSSVRTILHRPHPGGDMFQGLMSLAKSKLINDLGFEIKAVSLQQRPPQ